MASLELTSHRNTAEAAKKTQQANALTQAAGDSEQVDTNQDSIPTTMTNQPLTTTTTNPAPTTSTTTATNWTHTTTVEDINNEDGDECYNFSYCFVYLCLFIIFRSESWRCRFDSLLFDSYHCHTIDS